LSRSPILAKTIRPGARWWPADEVSDIEVHGDSLYVLTYKNALRYKVLRLDARHPDLASAETVVPAGEAVVSGISPAQDALYVQMPDGGLHRILRVPYGPHPKAEEVALPFRGTAFAAADPACRAHCST
jgi:prolyl oligopeptidase